MSVFWRLTLTYKNLNKASYMTVSNWTLCVVWKSKLQSIKRRGSRWFTQKNPCWLIIKRLMLTSAPSFQSRGFLAWRDWSPTSASEKREWKKKRQRCQPGDQGLLLHQTHRGLNAIWLRANLTLTLHKITLKSFILQLKNVFVRCEKKKKSSAEAAGSGRAGKKRIMMDF